MRRSWNNPVIDWLLDSDPSIRWQVMRDLTDTLAEIVAAGRPRVASEGWGVRMLDQQRHPGVDRDQAHLTTDILA